MPRLYAGTAVFCAGAAAFYYAHYHDPTPTADPMAVHLLSHPAYQLLHFGGLALMVAGVLVVVSSMVRGARS